MDRTTRNQNYNYSSLPEDDTNSVQRKEVAISPRYLIGTRTAFVICLLLILNIVLSITNAADTAKAVELLKTCEKKDIQDLPRPDPFVGLQSLKGMISLIVVASTPQV